MNMFARALAGSTGIPAPSPTLPRFAGEGADSALHPQFHKGRSCASPLPRSGGGTGWGPGPISAMGKRFAQALLLCLAVGGPAFAVEPSEKLADPALEARARAIATELRCLVCQNQSIDDSDAPLAKDLRLILREKLKDGASDAAVKDFLVSRYGDFVLLRPPLKLETLLLWGATPLLLIGGALAAFAAQRRSRGAPAAAALSDAERETLRALGAHVPEEEA